MALVLARKIDESIQIGADVTLTLVSIGQGRVVLAITTPQHSQTLPLIYGIPLRLEGGVAIALTEMDRGKVRLAITAPRDLLILRSELLPAREGGDPRCSTRSRNSPRNSATGN